MGSNGNLKPSCCDAEVDVGSRGAGLVALVEAVEEDVVRELDDEGCMGRARKGTLEHEPREYTMI